MDEKQKGTEPNLDSNTTPNPATKPTSADTSAAEKGAAGAAVTAETTESTPTESDTNTGMNTPSSDEDHTESSMMPMVVGAIILALGAIAAVWFFSTTDQTGSSSDQANGAVTSETEGDPNEVVATVNGVDLTRAEYNRIRQQVLQNAQMMGMDINDPDTQMQVNEQAIDTLVNTELIRQAAVASGSSVSQEQIEARFVEIVEQVGGEEALADSLEQLGLTEESLRTDIEQELVIQQFLDGAVDTEGLIATDAEVDELYEASGGAEAGLPPIDEVRPQIEQQILANKENELINELVESLRTDAEIDVHI